MSQMRGVSRKYKIDINESELKKNIENINESNINN